jgi:hypothetical protein
MSKFDRHGIIGFERGAQHLPCRVPDTKARSKLHATRIIVPSPLLLKCGQHRPKRTPAEADIPLTFKDD